VKKRKQKNPHAVALGRLGGSVCSEAKKRANKHNGREGGLVKSRKKTLAVRRNARRPSARKFTARAQPTADGLTGSRKIQAAHFSNERFSIASRGCDC